jgi:hypothetical protein
MKTAGQEPAVYLVTMPRAVLTSAETERRSQARPTARVGSWTILPDRQLSAGVPAQLACPPDRGHHHLWRNSITAGKRNSILRLRGSGTCHEDRNRRGNRYHLRDRGVETGGLVPSFPRLLDREASIAEVDDLEAGQGRLVRSLGMSDNISGCGGRNLHGPVLSVGPLPEWDRCRRTSQNRHASYSAYFAWLRITYWMTTPRADMLPGGGPNEP